MRTVEILCVDEEVKSDVRESYTTSGITRSGASVGRVLQDCGVRRGADFSSGYFPKVKWLYMSLIL